MLATNIMGRYSFRLKAVEDASQEVRVTISRGHGWHPGSLLPTT